MTTAVGLSMSEAKSNLTPRRTWPLGIYGLAAIWLVAVQVCLRLRIMGPTSLDFEPLVFASFAAPLALVAMSRIDLNKYIRFFAVLLSIKVIVNLGSELLTSFPSPLFFPKLQLYNFARLSIRDLRDFAVVISVAHAISSLTMTFVTSQPIKASNTNQARISDWLYFIALVSLTFFPQWPEPRLTYNTRMEVVFSLKSGAMRPSDLLTGTLELAPKIGAAITGLFWFTRFRSWRLKVLSLSLLTVQGLLCATFVLIVQRDFPFSLAFVTFVLMAIISSPFWILLRLAGYHAVTPIQSLFAKSVSPD